MRRKVKTEESPRLRPSDLRNFITMFVVFVLFAICWAPLNLIGLAVAIDPSRVAPRIPEWLFVVSYFMAYFNSCLNAIIYGLLNRNFRNEYKRIVTSVWVTRLFVTETSRAATDGRSLRHFEFVMYQRCLGLLVDGCRATEEMRSALTPGFSIKGSG